MDEKLLVAHIKAKMDAMERNNRGGFTTKQLIISSQVHILAVLLVDIVSGHLTERPEVHQAFAEKLSSKVNQECAGLH